MHHTPTPHHWLLNLFHDRSTTKPPPHLRHAQRRTMRYGTSDGLEETHTGTKSLDVGSSPPLNRLPGKLYRAHALPPTYHVGPQLTLLSADPHAPASKSSALSPFAFHLPNPPNPTPGPHLHCAQLQRESLQGEPGHALLEVAVDDHAHETAPLGQRGVGHGGACGLGWLESGGGEARPKRGGGAQERSNPIREGATGLAWHLTQRIQGSGVVVDAAAAPKAGSSGGEALAKKGVAGHNRGPIVLGKAPAGQSGGRHGGARGVGWLGMIGGGAHVAIVQPGFAGSCALRHWHCGLQGRIPHEHQAVYQLPVLPSPPKLAL